MVLKWLNSAKNWSFLEGEISYKETNVYEIGKNFLESWYSQRGEKPSVKLDNREDVLAEIDRISSETAELSEFPTFFNMVRAYIRNYFWKASDGRDITIDIADLSSQQLEVLSMVYIVEVDNQAKSCVDYVVLDRTKTFLLSDSGQTIEKIIR